MNLPPSHVPPAPDISRPDTSAALLVDDGLLLLKHAGRYEAAVFLRAHAVPLRIIARLLWPAGRRRGHRAGVRPN